MKETLYRVLFFGNMFCVGMNVAESIGSVWKHQLDWAAGHFIVSLVNGFAAYLCWLNLTMNEEEKI